MIVAVDDNKHSAYALEWTLDTSANPGFQFSQTAKKQVMIIAVNDGEHSPGVSVEWTLDHFFVPLGDSALFNLVIIHAKPFATIIFSLLLLLSNPDLEVGSNKRKYEDQTLPSSGGRRPTGFSSPDSVPRSYNSVPPPLDGIKMAKQCAQEVTARLTAASTLANTKHPCVENDSSDFDNKKALFLLHMCFTLARLLSEIEKRDGMIGPQQMIGPKMIGPQQMIGPKMIGPQMCLV
ncbi:hypothetical protein SLEP1_g38500 [Rubroshorea leprosula]|nr:hypothetical protein SLEP1_g38500 [Rubroshorea leprosula]